MTLARCLLPKLRPLCLFVIVSLTACTLTGSHTNHCIPVQDLLDAWEAAEETRKELSTELSTPLLASIPYKQRLS
jgi:hypothetical protein